MTVNTTNIAASCLTHIESEYGRGGFTTESFINMTLPARTGRASTEAREGDFSSTCDFQSDRRGWLSDGIKRSSRCAFGES